MLGALTSRVGQVGMDFFGRIGLSDKALISIAVDAAQYRENAKHWQRAPFGSSKRTTGGVRRKAKKQRAIVRARTRGHA